MVHDGLYKKKKKAVALQVTPEPEADHEEADHEDADHQDADHEEVADEADQGTQDKVDYKDTYVLQHLAAASKVLPKYVHDHKMVLEFLHFMLRRYEPAAQKAVA